MATKTQAYAENGVVLSKSPLYVGDEVTITYDGLLAKCGADKVYTYIGYGEEWEEKGFIPMTYEFDVFKATFKVLIAGSLNLAFKDSAENWDNNSGVNYTFKVSKRQKAASKVADAEKAEKAEKPAAKAKAVKTTTKAAAKTTTKSTSTATKAKTTRKKKEEQ